MAFTTMEINLAPSTSKYNEKIGKVLQKLLTPNFVLKNDIYLNLFLTHLISKSEGDKNLIQNEQLNEQFCQWIIQVSQIWDKGKVIPNSAIISFSLNLASKLSENEQVFVRMNNQNVYESLVGIAQKNQNRDATVVIGFVTLLCSFLEHKSGVQWVLATSYWTEIVNLGINAHTLYIKQKVYEFVIKLLQRTIKFNKNFCSNLIEILSKPVKDTLNNLPCTNRSITGEIENKELFESLTPSLNFLFEVTKSLLKTYDKDVLKLFLELQILETIQNILLLSQDQDFSSKLIKIILNLLFFKMCEALEGVKLITHDSKAVNEFQVFSDLLVSEIRKEHSRCVMIICHHGLFLWSYISKRMPMCIKKGETIEFQYQMLLIQTLPVMLLSLQFLGEAKAGYLMLNDDYRRNLTHKWVKLSAVKTIKLCYKWKEPLQKKKDLIDDVIFSLQLIGRNKKLLNKDSASLLFQPLVYSLKDSLTYIELHPEVNVGSKLIQFLDLLIETIIDLVITFDITWKDSIETISVLQLACEFLQHTNFVNKLVIKGLKLLDMSISKHMSPEMVLLMDSSKDSMINQTGSLLYAKCHDSSWEIRDSALEVVYTLSFNANTRFPAFKDILLDAELPQLVVKMALKDGEYYVRATAIKCLRELIQIPEMWELYLKMDNFLNDMLNIFQNETEGVVRQEAATLIYKIVKYHEFPEEILPRVYDVMTHATTGDLHWEVKVNALKFWYKTVEKYLMNQGMIDRTFPTVTFSKEHKKIVTLNDTEIRKRLIKVLNQLSDIGCLSVIKKAIEDSCDIEVSRSATEFTTCFVKLLKQYQVPCENIDFNQPATSLVQHQSDTTSVCTFATPSTGSPLTSSISSSPLQLSNPSPSSDIDSCSSDAITTPNSKVDLGIITPPNSVTEQTPTNQNNAISPSHPLIENSIPSKIPQNESDFVGLIEDNEMDYDATQASSTRFDSLAAEKMLDDLLNSNDITLLQKMYSPNDQVPNNTIQMKTKSYLPPSEYLKFVYDSVESHATRKTEWLNSLDEFDSLLDDILKEYNVGSDINSMDCY